jgi:hypothetical protein
MPIHLKAEKKPFESQQARNNVQKQQKAKE